MSDYSDIQQELDDFENAVYGEEVRDSMISAIKKIHDIAENAAGAPDASSATAGQSPIADGAGGWQWGDVATSGDSVPTEVRQAIFAILNNNAFANNSQYNAELAVIQSWAEATEEDSITLSASSGSLTVGNTRTITATVSGSGTLSAVSSDINVATVSVSGTTITMTAVSAGSATITATYGTASATYNVSVTAIQSYDYTSYLQTGLIAQFDGEQNTSSGHDSSATTWEDLIGSYDMVSNGTAGSSWDTDGLVFTGTTNAWVANSSPSDESNLTVELVYIPTNGIVSNAQQLAQIAMDSSTSARNQKISVFTDNSIGIIGASGKTYDVTNVNDVRVIQVIYGSESVTVYADGTKLSKGSNTHSFNFTFAGVGVNNNTNATYCVNGKICAFRIYNIALSEAQLQSNRAIDVNRFNL